MRRSPTMKTGMSRSTGTRSDCAADRAARPMSWSSQARRKRSGTRVQRRRTPGSRPICRRIVPGAYRKPKAFAQASVRKKAPEACHFTFAFLSGVTFEAANRKWRLYVGSRPCRVDLAEVGRFEAPRRIFVFA